MYVLPHIKWNNWILPGHLTILSMHKPSNPTVACSGACGPLILSRWLRWALHHDVLNYWEAVWTLVWDQLSLVSLRAAVALDLFEAPELFTLCLSGSSFLAGLSRRSAEWQPCFLSSSSDFTWPYIFFLFFFTSSFLFPVSDSVVQVSYCCFLVSHVLYTMQDFWSGTRT